MHSSKNRDGMAKKNLQNLKKQVNHKITYEICSPGREPTGAINKLRHLSDNFDKLQEVRCWLPRQWETPGVHNLSGFQILFGALPQDCQNEDPRQIPS
jgi:hypothetical protein